jgi:hypothetical protein
MLPHQFIEWYNKWVKETLWKRYNDAGHPLYEAVRVHEAIHVQQVEKVVPEIEKHFKEKYSEEYCYRREDERDAALKQASKNAGREWKYIPQIDSRGNEYAEKAAAEAEWEFYKKKFEEYNKRGETP